MSKSTAIIDTEKQVMRCTVCGDEIPIPLGDILWACGVMKLFEQSHPKTPHDSGRTMLAKPVPAKGTTP